MRKVGERTDLLIYERLRIAVKQTEPRSPSAPRRARGFMLTSRRRHAIRAAEYAPADAGQTDDDPHDAAEEITAR